MPVSEVQAAETFLYQQLQTLAGGRVYRVRAPLGTAYPLIVYQVLPGPGDLMTVGPARVWTELEALVKVAQDVNTLSTIAPIGVAIDTALHGIQALVGAARVSCVRKNTYPTETLESGVWYVEIIGRYTLWVYQA